MPIAKVFFEVDMRLGIDGLTELLKEKRVGPVGGKMCMFLNRKKNYVKIMWAGQYVLQFRKSHGRITIEELKHLPSYFRGEFVPSGIEKQLLKYVDESPSVHIEESGLKVS